MGIVYSLSTPFNGSLDTCVRALAYVILSYCLSKHS